MIDLNTPQRGKNEKTGYNNTKNSLIFQENLIKIGLDNFFKEINLAEDKKEFINNFIIQYDKKILTNILNNMKNYNFEETELKEILEKNISYNNEYR